MFTNASLGGPTLAIFPQSFQGGHSLDVAAPRAERITDLLHMENCW